ncbi:glycoside hydrolase [Meredithblackwellia eburnea MCA 4105]
MATTDEHSSTPIRSRRRLPLTKPSRPSISSPFSPSRPTSTRTTRPSSRREAKAGTFALLFATVLALVFANTPTVQAATFEPPGNQILFGAWIDSQAGYSDRPASFNQRLGYNVPVYQIAQTIPLPPYNYTTGAGGAALENLIELSETDAAVFLTVYPAGGFSTVADSDFAALGLQILDYQKSLNRTVFLRYAPEFQGTWNKYGMQPTAFIQSWINMHTIISATAPGTLFVWAPNTPQSYPYGYTWASANISAADETLLDTNHDGVLDAGDDAFSPWYPGDEYVDWIGLSLYYKGPSYSDITNVVQTPGYCALAINGTNPADNSVITNWYNTYCALKPEKACMLAESGAAYHVNDAGSSQLALQTEWIADCITNTTFMDQYPRLKMIMQFEYEKVEDSNEGTQDLRDYRITNNTEVLAAFISELAPVATRFSWANYRAKPTSISSPGAPAATNSLGSTSVQAITATTRARPTTFPSLFGLTSGSQRQEIIELVALVTSCIIGMVSVMKML